MGVAELLGVCHSTGRARGVAGSAGMRSVETAARAPFIGLYRLELGRVCGSAGTGLVPECAPEVRRKPQHGDRRRLK